MVNFDKKLGLGQTPPSLGQNPNFYQKFVLEASLTGGELPGKVHGGAPVGNNGRVGNWPSRAESPPKKMKLSKNPNGEEKR